MIVTGRSGHEAVSVDSPSAPWASFQEIEGRDRRHSAKMDIDKAPFGRPPEEVRVAGLLRETEASENTIYHCFGAWECRGRSRSGSGSNMHRHLRGPFQA